MPTPSLAWGLPGNAFLPWLTRGSRWKICLGSPGSPWSPHWTQWLRSAKSRLESVQHPRLECLLRATYPTSVVVLIVPLPGLGQPGKTPGKAEYPWSLWKKAKRKESAWDAVYLSVEQERTRLRERHSLSRDPVWVECAQGFTGSGRV